MKLLIGAHMAHTIQRPRYTLFQQTISQVYRQFLLSSLLLCIQTINLRQAFSRSCFGCSCCFEWIGFKRERYSVQIKRNLFGPNIRTIDRVYQLGKSHAFAQIAFSQQSFLPCLEIKYPFRCSKRLTVLSETSLKLTPHSVIKSFTEKPGFSFLSLSKFRISILSCLADSFLGRPLRRQQCNLLWIPTFKTLVAEAGEIPQTFAI